MFLRLHHKITGNADRRALLLFCTASNREVRLQFRNLFEGLPSRLGSGANFLACMFLSWREGFADFRRRGPLPKVPERWLLFRLVV